MSFKTNLVIMRQQWAIEPGAAVHLLDTWLKVRSGEVKWGAESDPLAESESDPLAEGDGVHSVSLRAMYVQLMGADKITMAPTARYQMREFKGFEGSEVAVIPLSGPMMKADNCGDFGTESMRQMVQLAAKAQSVHTIVMLEDTPGGTVDGTEALGAEIKKSGKRTICVADGMMCSAGYWVGSSCDEVYAANQTTEIGSIGTMISLMDDSKYLENKGIVLREVYATESTDKNVAFSRARKGDVKKLVQERLDPTNNVFLSTVKENRAGKLSAKENVLSGKVYIAAEAVKHGLIDGIRSMDEVLKDAIAKRGARVPKAIAPPSTIVFNSNNNMEELKTLADFKAQYPGLFNEAVQQGRTEGATAERARVESWMAWESSDPEAAAAGVAGGKELTPADVKLMSATAAKKAATAALAADNPKDVKPDSNTKPMSEEDKSLAANKAELLESLGFEPKK